MTPRARAGTVLRNGPAWSAGEFGHEQAPSRLAPVFSFLLAAASLAGRWTHFTLYLKHGAVASDRGRFGLYSRSIFDRMAVFDADWLEIAVAFGFLTLVLALLWALSRRLETVILAGAHQCPRCGYDLTANTSGTCPECGRAVESR